MLRARLRTYGSLVAFSHTLFAMPFAASAVVLAFGVPHASLTLSKVIAMLLCMVSARTSAMAFNRYVDRDIDAKNPRTKLREVPSGRVSPREAIALTAVGGVLFVASSATIGTLPLMLSPFVLAVLLGYSFAKRFTWGAHAWLGVALSLAPGGAWIAMGATPSLAIGLLMIAVATWLLGFDVLYALQDESFDRAHGLRSIPARFGVHCAIQIARAAHVATVVALACVGICLGVGYIYAAAVVFVACLLTYEHTLVKEHDLSRIDRAFFDVNAWVSVGFFLLTLSDAAARYLSP